MATFNTKIPLSPDDPNEMMLVHRGETGSITENFTEDELFNPKNGLDAHPLSMDTVRAVQHVRSYFGLPIRVTSTYRNYVPSGSGVVNAAQRSPHMLAQAIDFQFIDTEKRPDLQVAIREDFASKGELWQQLWAMGVRGFGVYDSFIHLDTVKSELYADFRSKRTNTHEGQQYAYWNSMKELRYVSATGNKFIRQLKEQFGTVVGMGAELANGEDRGTDIEFKHILRIVGMLTVGSSLIIGFFWLKRKFAL